jgi:DNA-binding MarR family transcriptional regulator
MPQVPELEAVTEVLLEASKALVGIAMRTIPPESGVTLAQFRALVLLDQCGGMRAGDLAQALAVTPSTATRLCDRLVRDGFATRVMSQHDRREVLLSITGSGSKVVRAALAHRRRELGRLVANIPVKDRAAFIRCLKLFQAAQQPPTEPAWALGWSGGPARGRDRSEVSLA